MINAYALVAASCLIITAPTNLSTHDHCSPRLDVANEIKHPCDPSKGQCHLTRVGVVLTQQFEGFSPFKYKDQVDVWTIGFGHAIKPGEHFQEPMSGIQAQNLLETDVKEREKDLNKLVKTGLTSGQYDALMSLTYNIGAGRVKSSTLLKQVNKKQHTKVAPEFLKWDRAGGKVNQGLHTRRKTEATLYSMSTTETVVASNP